jgi:hypothetical protein
MFEQNLADTLPELIEKPRHLTALRVAIALPPCSRAS